MELLQGVRPFYFITFVTHFRKTSLANDAVHAAFRSFAERAHAEHGIAVGRYVLMPDHVLRGGERYSQKWDYVRQNPVRAGLVHDANDWPFQGEIVRLPFD